MLFVAVWKSAEVLELRALLFRLQLALASR